MYCFLDTNIFHEFKPITEINWVKELGTSEVCLVVTSIVVQELDKHKSGNNNRLRKKARQWTAFLENLDVGTDNEIRQNVTLRFDLSEPKQGIFHESNLSIDVADDRLLAKAIEFANLDEGNDIAVVSDDSAMRLKARGHNLGVPTLSDDNRLKYEPDPIMQELNELRIENQRLQNTQPKLEFGFRNEDGSTTGVLKLERGTFETLTNENEIQAAIHSEYKRHKEPSNLGKGDYRFPTTSLLLASSDQVSDFHNDLNRWLHNDFRNHLIRNSRYRACKSQNIVLPLLLKNAGSAPAEGTRVDITVRGCRAIYDEMPEEPVMSAAPSLTDYVGLNPNAKRFVYFAGGGGAYWNQTQFNESPLELETGDEHQLHFSIDKILHHDSFGLGDHIAVIDNPSRFPVVIVLEYLVITENHPDKLEGELKVIIKQKEP